MLAAAKDLRERSFGAATAKYRELGTMANLLAFNAISTLPTRNFSAAQFEGAPALGRRGDRGAPTGGAQLVRVVLDRVRAHLQGPGGQEDQDGVRERVRARPLCGVSDADAVIAASSRCDELGLDTISTGGTIAWAMECAEKGLIDAPWLRFGDAEALLRAIEEIGAREGLGDLLAERVARRVESGRRRDPRRSPRTSRASSCPGTSRGRSRRWRSGWRSTPAAPTTTARGAYEADLSGVHDRLAGGEPHVAGAIETENRAAVMDSLILCKFLRGVFEDPFPEWARLLELVTGWDVDADELATTARRIVLAKRLFNLREGWTREEDWLPERFLSESLELESGRTATLTAEPPRGDDQLVLPRSRSRARRACQPGRSASCH